MGYRFTDDDRGRDVVTSEGNRIGTIDRVHGDRATVDRDDDESLTDKVKDMLGWGDDDTYELRDEHVDEEREGKIYLRHY